MDKSYSNSLVLLSIAVAIVASYVALDLASRVTASRDSKAARYWLIGGAISMGIGIWSMHFIGMLALHLPIAMSYDVPITLLSLVIAGLVSGFALYTINRGTLALPRLLGAGTLMGVGIASMHYTGMAAMQMQPPIRYDMGLLGLSIVVAICASVAALSIAFRLRLGTMRSALGARVGSALIMGVAICGMHYIGMAAAQFAPNSICTVDPQAIHNGWLAGAVGVFALMALAATLMISLFDVRLTERSAEFADELRERNRFLAKQALDLADANARLQDEMHERSRAQRALQESESHFRNAFDFATIGMALMSLQGRWLQVNRALCQIIGYSEDELLARTFQDVSHPDDLNANLEYARQLLGGEIKTYQMEKRYLHKGGHAVWVLLSVSLVREENGAPVHFIAQMQDISGRKHAEQARRESEERFQLVVQGTHDGIWDWNMITDECYYSPRYKELLGFDGEDMRAVRASFEKRLHAEDLRPTLKALQAHLTKKIPYDTQYRLRVESGEYRWFHARGQACWDADGKPIRFTGALRDITEHKQNELAVERSEKFLHAIIDSLPQPIFVKDQAHRWVLVNQRFCETAGRDRHTLIGRSDPDVFSSEAVERVWAEDDQAMRMRQPLFVETQEVRPDGSVAWLLKSKQRVDLPDGAHIVGILTDITPQKQTELALRESEGRFRGLTQLSADWFWEQDEQFRFTSQIGGGLTSMNIAPDYMLGKMRWELPFVNMRDTDWDEHKTMLLAHRAFHDLELCRRNDDGELRYVSLSGEPVFDASGVFKGYRGVGRDITARKNVEQALRDSEESHRLLAENSSDMIVRVTPSGLLTYASPASFGALGYHPEELLGRAVPDFIHPSEREEAARLYGEVVRKNVVNVVTCRLRRRDASWIWMETSFRAVRDEASQRTVQVIGVSRNVDERIRVTEALNRFKYVLDHTLDMIYIFDAETLRFSYVNEGAALGLGYERDALLSMAPWDLRPDATEAQYRQMIEPFLRGEIQSRHFETVHRRADGNEMPVDVTMQLMRRAGETGTFIAVIRDASERKKIDRMKNEFVSTVSHELRTPLTSIRGSLGLVAGGAAGQLPEHAMKLVTIAHNNSERLVRLINDILDMEKIESGKMRFDMQSHSIRTLLEQAVEANRAYGEQLRVRFEIQGEIPDAQIIADSDRFMQVMANLLSNAAKFSPSPGVVEVTVRKAQPGLRISVTDHGPGIPEEFRSTIFGKFSQADSTDSRQKGGTGLGLSIVKAIIEKHGGDVAFDSEIGRGTTFHVGFQLAPQAAASDAPAPCAGQRRVLICEDDAQAASAIGAVLEQAGFETEIASTLSAARTLLARHTYAAVTLDLLLPDGDGVELIRELRQSAATRDLPVVVISRDTQDGRIRLNGCASQVVGWLDKPVSPGNLLDLVRTNIAKGHGQKARILHVEDDEDVKQVVASIAGDVAIFDSASGVSEALSLIRRHTYSLVILDVGLRNGSGWDLLPALNELPSPPPVIVFSAQNLDPERSKSVAAALTKASTSNQHLLDVIKHVTGIAADAPAMQESQPS
jgi:PAS domain S-box-containing protein